MVILIARLSGHYALKMYAVFSLKKTPTIWTWTVICQIAILSKFNQTNINAISIWRCSNLIQNEIYRLLLCKDTSVGSKTLDTMTISIKQFPYTLIWPKIQLYSLNGLIDFWCLMPLSAIYFSCIMATSFSGGRTRREPPTMGKQLVNFITLGCKSSSPFL